MLFPDHPHLSCTFLHAPACAVSLVVSLDSQHDIFLLPASLRTPKPPFRASLLKQQDRQARLSECQTNYRALELKQHPEAIPIA